MPLSQWKHGAPPHSNHGGHSSNSSSPKKSIVIIGGGIIGCTTAYFLTRHPRYDPSVHTIHLIEATSIASGASGKAGGLLALWAYPACLVPLSFKLHADLATEHDGAERWGYRGVGVGQIELVGRKITERQRQRSHRGPALMVAKKKGGVKIYGVASP